MLEIPPRLIPEPPTLDNFVRAWSSNDFGRLLPQQRRRRHALDDHLGDRSRRCSAFAFARYEFPGRRVLFGGAAVHDDGARAWCCSSRSSSLARNLGLLNSLWGLVVVYSVLNLGPQHVPAARLLRGDAAGDLRRRRRSTAPGPWPAVPLGRACRWRRPGLATVTIFSFLAAWDEFTWAIVDPVRQASSTRCPSRIRSFQRANGTEWGLVFAASLIALAPVLVLFVALQRHFVSGAFQGATKG